MSFKSDLWTYLTQNTDLSAAVGDRIYPGFAPSSAARPFIIYSRISSDSTHHLGTASIAPGGLMRDVMQFDIYAETESAANEVKEILQDVLNGQEMVMGGTQIRRVFLSNETDGMEPPSDGTNDAEYRETMEFVFWYLRPTPAIEDSILKEDGTYILMENDGFVLMEAS